MRRTAAAAIVAALVLAGCDGDSSEPEQDPSPGVPPTGSQTTEDEPTGEEPTEDEPDDGAADEGDDDAATDDAEDADDDATDDDATDDDAATDDGTDDGTAGPDEDADAPGLADGPEWLDPEEEVRVDPVRDAIEEGQEITGIRMASHDGFDRVVLDLTGDEVVLGWFGLYEDAPVEAGSGNPIDFAGNAVLSVPVDGIDWLNPHPDRADGSEIGGPGGTENAVEVLFGVLFEGQQQVFVSVMDRTPYRIYPLNDPARIVIDVQHP